MASTKIAFYIYNLLIISPGIHVYVYYMVFAKLLKENYFKNVVKFNSSCLDKYLDKSMTVVCHHIFDQWRI
jgi:hypothetical protein